MRGLVSFCVGGVFGMGLLLSGMTNTKKVQGWLDLTGAWDPTLAFVMGGAILPMAIAWQLSRQKATPRFGDAFPQRPDPDITSSLAIGSILFGIGWGLSGLCPGPAMASLGFGGGSSWIFFVAMAFAMSLQPYVTNAVTKVIQ